MPTHTSSRTESVLCDARRGRRQPLILTASSLGCLFSCARRYYLSTVCGWCRVRDAEPLRFGSAIHAALEARANGNAFESAMAVALDGHGDALDAHLAASASALIAGYYARWAGDDFSVSPECEFAVRVPFLRDVILAGKIDGIVHWANGDTGIIEHKTTAQDIAYDSEYWQTINRDQIAIYKIAAERNPRALGLRCDETIKGILYDVIRKPTIKPAKATPPEKRKYTKDGQLYASCRAADESADEWGERLLADISARPGDYYARRGIPLLDSDLDRLARRLWAARRILATYAEMERRFAAEGAGRFEAWPKCGSPLVCKSCQFRGLCDSDEMPQGDWERGRAHRELDIVAKFTGPARP